MRLFILAPVLACSLLTPFASAYKLWIWRDSKNCTGVANYVYDYGSDNDCDWPEVGIH